MRLKLFLTILPAFACMYLRGQTHTIDSLKHSVFIAKNDDEKLAAVFTLCAKRHSLSTDTLYRYANIAETISHEKDNAHDIILSDYYYINYLIKKGRPDTALSVCDKDISKISGNENDRKLYLNLVATRAGLLVKLNRYKESYFTYYKLLNESEKYKDTLNELLAYTGLGWVNMEMDNNAEALRFLKINLQKPAINDVARYGEYYSFIYSNIASAYNSLNRNDSAKYYIDKSIYLAEKFENLTALANALAIKAQIMSDTKQNKEAEQDLLRVVDIRKQIGDPFFVVSDMSQLAVYYYHNNQPQKAVNTALQGIAMAEKNNLSSKLPLLYDALAQSYKGAGNYKMYAETLKKIIDLKDSLYTKNSAEALAEIQGKYEVQKKENTIAQQNLKIIKSKNLLYSILGIFIFIAMLSIVLFYEYRKRQSLKAKLLQEEEKRNTELAIGNAAEKERKRIAADLHDNMGAYATAIIANVDDMIVNKNITDEPAFSSLKANAGELMSNLRDTIWASNKEKISIINISDRFKNYIQKINKAYPMVNIEITEAITDNPSFTPVQALNIFRILQEACTNALKHSNAKHIAVHFKCDKKLCIKISDNGSGFTNENYLQNGNGINNMRLRAKESGLQFVIKQKGTSGVTIIITSE